MLVLGTSAPDYAPFDITASGRDYEGLTADYAGLIGNTLNRPIRVKRFANRDKALQALIDGHIDLLGSANGYDAALPRWPCRAPMPKTCRCWSPAKMKPGHWTTASRGCA
ncbi:hypothetical protein NWF32_15860 [Pseudomonas qingdaonensis]|nr:hypothetical protein [Pseudomonas qingdaonensis]